MARACSGVASQSLLAQTQLSLVTQQYAGVRETLTELARLHRFAAYLPSGRATLAEIRADHAELHYWQRDYRALIPQQGDPMAELPSDNVRLQSIVANAVFREKYPAAKDQKSRLAALDAAIAAQLSVLRNSPNGTGVAYNYEYLRAPARRVAAGSRGRPSRAPGGDQGALGTPGRRAAGRPDPTDFKIHIPLESRELQDQKEGARSWQEHAPRERKG